MIAPIKEIQASIDDGRIRPDRAQIFRDALKPGGKVPIVQSPDDFHIFVAGGSPGYSLAVQLPGPELGERDKENQRRDIDEGRALEISGSWLYRRCAVHHSWSEPRGIHVEEACFDRVRNSRCGRCRSQRRAGRLARRHPVLRKSQRKRRRRSAAA